eukprot:scaffold14850_cov79-Skeletonema_dohrnii-CCMP3373.AAC.1
MEQGLFICPDNFGPPTFLEAHLLTNFCIHSDMRGFSIGIQVANLDSLRNAHWKEKVVTSMDVTWWQIYDFHVVSEIADMATWRSLHGWQVH